MVVDLELLTDGVSQTAVKHWLKVNGLEHTAQNTEEYYQRLAKLIEDEELTVEELREAVLEIQEYGGKRIYLRQLHGGKDFRLRRTFESQLNSLGMNLSATATKAVRLPSNPTLNYVTWSESQIRIKYSETHRRVEIDYETELPIATDLTKYIVIISDPQTGFTMVCLDPPEKIHPHRKYTRSRHIDPYEQKYLDKALEILGGSIFTPFNLNNVIAGLVSTDPRIFRLPHEFVITGDGLRQRNSSERDVRDHKAHVAGMSADSDDRTYEDLQGYWIPEQSGGQLHRELFMQLKRNTSMIRFLADCLASEVNYAISRIRELS